MKKWESYEKTIENLEKSFSKKCKKEYVNILQSHGRILAEDLKAGEDCPKFPTSSMDGYALRWEDQKLGKLKVISQVPAGADATMSLKQGECVKTFTGSLMIEGSDTLIPIENVEVMDDEIIIKEEVSFGFAVRPQGESYKKDDILIKKGTPIGYAQIATLAELGVVQVCVYIPPRVGIIATGNEIVDIGEPLQRSSQIRSSNHVGLACVAKEIGASPIIFGLVKDDKELIKKRILEALETCDMVVTTGGVSVGDYDFVKDVVREVGVENIVEGSAIKPGRHIRVAKIGEKYILALPGFPYSSLVGFYLYGVRLLESWLNVDFKRRFCEAIMEEDYPKRSPYTEFTTCNLHVRNTSLYVNLKGKVKGSSAIVTNLLENAALLCVPKDKKLIKKGEKVQILKLQA